MGRASRRKHERRAAGGKKVGTSEKRNPGAGTDTAVARGAGALGSVAVLNVGRGDLTLSFDKANTAERKKAKSVVQDMLKRGYAIFVQVDTKDGEPGWA